jgi:hypothetical protein
MSCYYFDIREGTRFVPDEEGLEFESLEAAETAAEIGRDRLRRAMFGWSRSRCGTNTAGGC